MGEKKRRLAVAASLTEQVAAAQRLHADGRLDEAQDIYRQVLQVDATRVDAWLGAGILARDSGAGDSAIKLFARAVALAPNDADARMHYAWALQDGDDIHAAAIQWRAACALRPGDAVLWESLGIVEQAAGEIERAAEAYRRADELEPAAFRRVKLATLVSPIPASRASIAAERERMDAVLDEILAAETVQPVSDPFTARLWTNFYLAYHGENDRALQSKTAAVYQRICPSLKYVAAHCEPTRGASAPGNGPGAAGRSPSVPETMNGREANAKAMDGAELPVRSADATAASTGRIRIGLISHFFRNHSIGRTSRGFFAQLSRERFEVTAIFIAPIVDDEFSQAVRRDAEHALIVPRDLAAARAQIAALQLDVLFYQDIGMEPFSYFLSFARLAPVQCTSFGHPDTTGVATIDYFISNDLYEPAGAPTHYSERLFMLRNLGSLAYYYRPVAPSPLKPRAAFNLPADRPLYLCPQNLFKVHPDMDDLIAAILRRDARGVVALVEGRVRNWSALLRKRWQQTMPDVQHRIVFVPRMREGDYLNLIALADVMLDTVHFNGMNTSLEAFAVGTPVVTLPAAFQRGRHTQAMYRRMGLDDLIASNTDAYVDQALRLANDADYRRAMSSRILASNAVLFEDAVTVREFERFFLAVVRR
jgi:predicted O-linked N-acetylglucosamine transferase (SPINDLY family)